VSKQPVIFGVLFFCSFVFLLLNLNFNVRTFKLTQEVQAVTLELQDVARDVELKELEYYTRTSLDKVYLVATESLEMHYPPRRHVFFNQFVVTQ
jgi:hypothetical protein